MGFRDDGPGITSSKRYCMKLRTVWLRYTERAGDFYSVQLQPQTAKGHIKVTSKVKLVNFGVTESHNTNTGAHNNYIIKDTVLISVYMYIHKHLTYL